MNTVRPECKITYKEDHALNSRIYGRFFTNAKKASMLEHGWRQAGITNGINDIHIGATGILRFDASEDPVMEVEVIEGHHRISVNPMGGVKYGYTFKELGKEDSQPFELNNEDRGEKWEFYIRTTPVPFTPVDPLRARATGREECRIAGGSKKGKVKKGRKTRKTRKMRRKA